jgi:vancomycin permeability regulator SanA
MMKKIKWIVVMLLLWIAGHMFYTIVDGCSDDGMPADVAVVLGNKVNPDGTPSERLKHRLLCAVDLYHRGRVKKIIVSGGLGMEGVYEGDAMRDYLVSMTIPEADILVDNAGINTRATVVNALHLRDSLNADKIIVVSQYYHITRTKMLFAKHGVRVSGASPAYVEVRDVYSLLREFAAFYQQWLEPIK